MTSLAESLWAKRQESTAIAALCSRPWIVTIGGETRGRGSTLGAVEAMVDYPFLPGLAVARHQLTNERWVRRALGDWVELRDRRHIARNFGVAAARQELRQCCCASIEGRR
jgi:hypothetical protein